MKSCPWDDIVEKCTWSLGLILKCFELEKIAQDEFELDSCCLRYTNTMLPFCECPFPNFKRENHVTVVIRPWIFPSEIPY